MYFSFELAFGGVTLNNHNITANLSEEVIQLKSLFQISVTFDPSISSNYPYYLID